MTQIILDAALASQLHQLNEAADLCDPSGQVLGRFIPAVDMSEWEPVSPEPSEEELQRREQETESYSTADVLAFLEKQG
jgi:hypothetical protein